MSSARCIIFKNPRQIGVPVSTVFIGLDLPSLSFSWTSWFIDAFGLLFFCYVFFLLPQFSNDSDVSGLAPTLSINRFKSNKCGIFSRTCVHSPCFDCKAVCFRHVCHLFHFFFFFFVTSGVHKSTSHRWTFFQVNPSTPSIPSFNAPPHPGISYLSFSEPALSSTPPLPTAHPSVHNYNPIGFHRFQNVVESIARSSFKTTGFYLWHNKDAPQVGVWFSLLISLISILSHGWSVVPSCLTAGGSCVCIFWISGNLLFFWQTQSYGAIYFILTHCIYHEISDIAIFFQIYETIYCYCIVYQLETHF